MELTPLDEITVRVFLTALETSESSLPTSVQNELHNVGKSFGSDLDTALNTLMDIAEHNCLQALYVKAYAGIQKLQRSQERNKFGLPEDLPPEANVVREIPNTSTRNNIGELDTSLDLADSGLTPKTC